MALLGLPVIFAVDSGEELLPLLHGAAGVVIGPGLVIPALRAAVDAERPVAIAGDAGDGVIMEPTPYGDGSQSENGSQDNAI